MPSPRLFFQLLASIHLSTTRDPTSSSVATLASPEGVPRTYGAVRLVSMGDDGGGKAATTTIVRLRELLHRWALGARHDDDVDDGEREEARAAAAAAAAAGGGGAAAPSIPPFVLQRLRRTLTVDSDDESCHSPEAAPDVPRGYCPVYVGLEQRRFVIPTSYLGHPVFRLLLEKAEEEFGFRQEGALAIPCETEAFKYILQCVERHDKGIAGDDVHEGNLAAALEPSSSIHHVS